jgi:hypothetical protein
MRSSLGKTVLLTSLMPDLYTTQFGAGLGMLDECRLFTELWEPGITNRNLEERVLEEGVLPNVTARRVRNLVSEMWSPRFSREDFTPAKDLKRVIDYLSRNSLSQFICLFTARAQLIFRDFLSELFWPIYESGRSVMDRQEVKDFIIQAMDEGKTVKRWTDNMVNRVTGYLAGAGIDFDYLNKNGQGSYELSPPSIDHKLAIYLAYDLHFKNLSDNAVLSHEDWKLWGMNAEDVFRQLQYLGRSGHFMVQGSTDLVRLNWTYKTKEEVLDVIAR